MLSFLFSFGRLLTKATKRFQTWCSTSTSKDNTLLYKLWWAVGIKTFVKNVPDTSQGSVATYPRCGAMSDDDHIAIFYQISWRKGFKNRFALDEDFDEDCMHALFVVHTVARS